jgi:hypothetical protein
VWLWIAAATMFFSALSGAPGARQIPGVLQRAALIALWFLLPA